MPDQDDYVDPRLLVDRSGDRISQLEQEISELKDQLDAVAQSRQSAPDLTLINQNIGLLAQRASALEQFIRNMEGQDGITVQGNKIILDKQKPIIPTYAPILDLTVYDVDEETILYTGSQQHFVNVSDISDEQVEMFYVWTEFCIEDETYISLVMRSLNVAS